MKPIVRHKRFIKNYKRRVLPKRALDKQFESRVRLFLVGVRDEPINDHGLKGQHDGERAFSITGDVRVIYRETEDAFEFLDIGTHNQVYK